MYSPQIWVCHYQVAPIVFIKTFKHCKDTDFFLFLQEIRYFFRFAQEVPSLYLRTKLAVTPIAKRSFTDFAPTLVRRKNGGGAKL